MDFKPDSYYGRCVVCGWEGEFFRTKRAIRETYRCGECKALLREQGQAQALLDLYGAADDAQSLAELVGREYFARLSVYEPGVAGALRPYLSTVADYTQSFYYPEHERGQHNQRVRHEDLEALSFQSNRFDVVVTSDVLEHVRHPSKALREIHRVLKSGGLNLFTVPLQEPLAEKTVWRVDTSGPEDINILPEQYHGDGRGGRSLVYSNFGRDILYVLSDTGFEASFVHPETASEVANCAITVIAVKRLISSNL